MRAGDDLACLCAGDDLLDTDVQTGEYRGIDDSIHGGAYRNCQCPHDHCCGKHTF